MHEPIRSATANVPLVRPTPRSRVLLTAVAALAAVIFVADTTTHREIAFAVFYVVVVLLSLRALDRRGVVLVALGCASLTVVSYALTPTGSHESGLANSVISLAAIGVTTLLALRTAAADAAAQEARAQLAHTARVMALGELTAAIAHEVNQPLTAIVASGNACARWLAMDEPNVARAAQAARRIVDDANRASEIVGRVRRLATQAPAREDLVGVDEMVRDVLALTRRELAQCDVVASVDIPGDLPRLRLDRVQIQQVLLNLILNALDAMRPTTGVERRLQVRCARGGDGGVLVSVRDTGPGITPADRDRIFDAFYTTKPSGLGIGLAISRSIVEAHDGRIWAAPDAEVGAAFHVSLPASRMAS